MLSKTTHHVLLRRTHHAIEDSASFYIFFEVYMFYYGYDMTYLIFVLPAMLIAMWAQANVTSTFNKYSRTPSDRGLTGRDAARRILDGAGLHHVQVVPTEGNLTDHYDPKENVIRLSTPVYNVASAAAVGVAAHEAGHAIQHATGYFPIKLRMAVIPVANLGSKLALPLVILGLLLSFPPVAYAGIIFFCAAVFFQLVTLPVEFNASSRAMALMREGYMQGEEGLKASRKVLTAAALTYVAALFVSLMNLLRLILIVNRRSRR